MRAYGQRLVLKVDPIPEKKGSLIIPESARKKLSQTRKGVVVGLGDVPDFDYEVTVGDEVMFDNKKIIVEENGEVLIPKDAILYAYAR